MQDTGYRGVITAVCKWVWGGNRGMQVDRIGWNSRLSQVPNKSLQPVEETGVCKWIKADTGVCKWVGAETVVCKWIGADKILRNSRSIMSL